MPGPSTRPVRSTARPAGAPCRTGWRWNRPGASRSPRPRCSFPTPPRTGQDCVINLLDTPGHADFSEDTYRVLSAVDCAVMLIDAAKGLEPQTLKLFQVSRHRRIPILTVINKWDRPGRNALELLDEIQQRIGLKPTPLTWPVGIAGDFKGCSTGGPATSSGSPARRAARRGGTRGAHLARPGRGCRRGRLGQCRRGVRTALRRRE